MHLQNEKGSKAMKQGIGVSTLTDKKPATLPQAQQGWPSNNLLLKSLTKRHSVVLRRFLREMPLQVNRYKTYIDRAKLLIGRIQENIPRKKCYTYTKLLNLVFTILLRINSNG
ncbi:hypothetical protein OB13_00855 [Pontibacter sp. HJ8]